MNRRPALPEALTFSREAMDTTDSEVPDWFDDDAKLILKAKEYRQTLERLKEEAKLDPLRTPTPTLLAKELQITIDELHELADFALNNLAEFEMDYIHSRNPSFIDINTGKPLSREERF